MIDDMLSTPLGNISLYFDGQKVPFEFEVIPRDEKYYPDIDACYLVVWKYQADRNDHALKFVLDNANIDADSETGENLEAISIYSGSLKLTMGLFGDFGWPPESKDDFDFSGELLKNGILVDIVNTTKTQPFFFGVAWIENCTDDNDAQTWFAADPYTHRDLMSSMCEKIGIYDFIHTDKNNNNRYF